MVRFPNCKINIGLHVTSKREDGYHNIETIFYPVALKDALEIISADNLSFDFTGLTINGNVEHNLCYKAYELLLKDFPQIKPVQVHLHKAIPMGAGLGGGSSNAAFMLQMLNDKFDLKLSEEALINCALQLGSDCPFFILNKPCFASGRGEILQPLQVDLSMYDLVIINPAIHVSTTEAFSSLNPMQPGVSLQSLITQPISTWKDDIKNDFEETVFETYPAIKEIKEVMYSQGALYASMTGSGSTVYGIFVKNSNPMFYLPEHYNIVVLKATK